jgi:hypothetical protein
MILGIMFRNELPQTPASSPPSPVSPVVMKALAAFVALGAGVAALNDCQSQDFNPRRALRNLSDEQEVNIASRVKADVDLCMRGLLSGHTGLPGILRQNDPNLINVPISARCQSTPGASTGSHLYTVSFGPDDCSNTFTTTDGSNFSLCTLKKRLRVEYYCAEMFSFLSSNPPLLSSSRPHSVRAEKKFFVLFPNTLNQLPLLFACFSCYFQENFLFFSRRSVAEKF